MKIIRRRLDIPDDMDERLKTMTSQIGQNSFKSLFNISLTVLKWVIDQWLSGKRIYSLDPISGQAEELNLERMFIKKEKQENIDDDWAEIIEYSINDE